MPISRDNFSKATVERLAKMAGGRCSNPRCRRPTFGASPSGGVLNIGVAAHITAASPGGPRYDSSLNPDQRKDHLNGIWLCQTDAHLVDSDSQHFTVEVLREWKDQAAKESFRDLVAPSAAGDRWMEAAGLGRLGLPAEKLLESTLGRLIDAAKVDLAGFKRMPGWPTQPTVLNLTMADGDSVQPFSASSLVAAIETFNEIAVIAPPGTGKTTTLLQLVEAVLSRGHSLAVFIPLNEWSVQSESVFRLILRRHAFAGAREEDLKLLAEHARLVLAMDGWNEVDPGSRKSARLEIAALRRDFPDLGIVVSTRLKALDLPISGRRVQIERLAEKQQLEIARALRGPQGESILDQAWRTAGIHELVAIPLYLTALLAHAPGQTFPTTKEEVLRLFVAVQERGKDDGELLRGALFGCHAEMLTALAVEATQTANTSMAESRARQVITQTAHQLSARGQIATAPEPMSVLDVLVDHHLLVRSTTDLRDISFQHQQFQEWYASFEVEMLMRAAAAGDPEPRKRLRAEALNLPAWEEPIIFACERMSRADAAGVQGVAAAVVETLSIDPMFAAEMMYRSSTGVWEKIKDRILGFVDRWRVAGRVDRAVHFMITTGRAEFAPHIWPLISHDDDQIQLRALRAGHRFRASVLGPDLQARIAGLPEPVRQRMVSEMVHNGGIQEIELGARIASSDASHLVKVSAIEALLFVQADRMAAEVLRTAPDDVWRQLASRGYSEEIGDPDSRAHLRQLRQQCIDSETNPLRKLRLLLDVGRGGGTVGADVGKLLEADDFPVKESDGHWAVAEAYRLFPSDTTVALLRRLEAGKDLPYGAETFLQATGIIVDEGAVVDFVLKSDGADRLAEAAVRIVGPHTVGKMIDSMLDLHSKLMAEGSAGGADDAMREAYWRLSGLLSKTRLISFVEAVLSQSAATEPSVIALLADLVGRHGHGESARPWKLETDLRQRMIDTARRWAETLLADPRATRSRLAEVAGAIARLAVPELVPVLRRMLMEDLARWKQAREEFLAAHAAGNRGPSDAQHSWTLQYRHAFAAIGGAEVIELMKQYLPDRGYCGFGLEAAGALKDIYDRENPQKDKPLLWGREFSNVKANRAARQQGTPLESSALAEVIITVVNDLVTPKAGEEAHRHALRLATVAFRMPYGDETVRLEELLHLPLPLLEKRTLLGVLVLAGEIISGDMVLGGIKALLEEAETKRWLLDDNQGILSDWLELLPFSDRPASTLDALELLDQNLRHPWRLRGLLSALGYAPSSEAEDVLNELCRKDPRFLAEHDWLSALEKRDTASAARVLLERVCDARLKIGAGEADGWTLSRGLARAMRAHANFRAEVYERFQRLPPGPSKSVVEGAIVEAADEEAVLLLVRDHAACGKAFNGALSTALRHVAVGDVPSEAGQTTYMVSVPLPNLRKRLFALTEHDTAEARLAAACLATIDELRDDYGRAESEPRHPDIESGRPWPAPPFPR